VIDTPLGRLDSDHRRHLVERYFPHASNQMVLLSTDQEIDEDLGRLFMSAVGRCYRLDHDDAQATTRICPGYFWEQADSDVA
jgi:DNA sulfur modification protein DndD